MLELDHLVVSTSDLDAGTRHIEALLGVPVETGGKHAFMGTHNTLLSLGGDQYLEVIAIDPDAVAPDRPRWFGLDAFDGPARLTNWVCRSDDMQADIAQAPVEMDDVMDATRGELRWKMALTRDGQYPFGGAFPGIIAWQGKARPTQYLPDRGVRLTGLRIAHPRADMVNSALSRLEQDGSVAFVQAAITRLTAILQTPNGEVVLT